MKPRLCSLLFLITLALTSITILAQQDGIQFETVPLSSSSNCNPIIFRGTQRYAGLAFIMPRLRMAKSPRGTKAFEFLNLSNGRKALQLGLYFPKFIVDNYAESIVYEDYVQNQCDYQEIISELNRGKKKPTDEEIKNGQSNGYITDIVTLQVKNVGVKVQGIPGKSWATDESTDILSYQGQVKNIEIPLENEDQHRDIITRLESGGGLNMNIDFQFKARESNGYCKFTVDLSNVAKQVRASLNGQYDLSKSTKFPVGKLSGVFGSAIKNSTFSANSNSYCEEGNGKTFQKAYMQIVSRYLGAIKHHLTGPYAGDTQGSFLGTNPGYQFDNPNQQFNNDLGGDFQGDSQGIEPMPGEGFTPTFGQDPSLQGQGPDQLPRNLRPTKFQGDGVALQGMLQKLEQEKAMSITMSSLGKNTIRTFTTSLSVFKSTGEPGRTLIRLSSLNSKTNDSGKLLKAGDEIKIYPSYETIKKYSFEESTIYYSESDLTNLRHRYFSKLNLIPKEKVHTESLFDQTIAVLEETYWNQNAFVKWDELNTGGKTTFVTSYMAGGAVMPVKYWTHYRWGEKNVRRVLNSENPLSLSSRNKSQEYIINNFRLGLVFDKVAPNSIFSIKDLYTNRDKYSEYLDIDYNYSQNLFTLNVKKDLGRLYVKNLKVTETKSKASKYYFEEVKKWKSNWVMLDQKIRTKFVTTFSGKEVYTNQPSEVSVLTFNIQKDIDIDENFIPVDLHNESGDDESPGSHSSSPQFFEDVDVIN